MKTTTGFTLIELMMTIALLAIVTSLAVPAMTKLVKDNQQVSITNELIGLLNYARTEAVSQSVPVSLCASDNSTSCNTNNWEKGAILFKGVASAGTSPAAADILRVWEPLTDGTTLRRQSNSSTAPAGYNAAYLRYQNNGKLAAADASAFKLCDDRGEKSARGININSIGQARSATDSDADGTVEIIHDAVLEEITCP